MLRRAILLLLIALAALPLAGCGGGTPSAPAYTVSGRILDQASQGVGGVVLSFTGTTTTATTLADGSWQKDGLSGSVTVTPAKTGWTFAPPSRQVTGARSDVDFSATPPAGPSSDATLSSLAISAGTLSPAFAGATTSYSVEENAGTASVTLTPTAQDDGATIKVNGVACTSGQPSQVINLGIGITSVPVLVTAEDGSTKKTYTISISRFYGSAKEWLQDHPGAASGLYTFDLDGTGPEPPVTTYADMTVDGGGWTLVAYASGNASPLQSLATGGGTWNAPARTGNAALNALALARRSTYIAYAFGFSTPQIGGIDDHAKAVRVTIPVPSAVTFDPANASTRGPAEAATAVAIRGGLNGSSFYHFRNSLGMMDGTHPVYGFTTTADCSTVTNMDFALSTGSDNGKNWVINTGLLNQSGSVSIWLK